MPAMSPIERNGFPPNEPGYWRDLVPQSDLRKERGAPLVLAKEGMCRILALVSAGVTEAEAFRLENISSDTLARYRRKAQDTTDDSPRADQDLQMFMGPLLQMAHELYNDELDRRASSGRLTNTLAGFKTKSRTIAKEVLHRDEVIVLKTTITDLEVDERQVPLPMMPRIDSANALKLQEIRQFVNKKNAETKERDRLEYERRREQAERNRIQPSLPLGFNEPARAVKPISLGRRDSGATADAGEAEN